MPHPIKRAVPFAVGFALLFWTSISFGFSLPPGLEVDSFVQNEIAYRYRAEPAFTKLLTFYQLETRYRLSDWGRITLIGRISYDAIYDLQSLSTISPFPNRFDPTAPRPTEVKHFYPRVREAYIDLFFPKVDLRIGTQIARWGVIEGFRITDELNPLDFSEFLMREIGDRYIPVFMVKADYYRQDTTWEGVWIPELAFNRPAPPGSEWEEFQLPPNLKTPPQTLGNSNVGARVTRQIAGWELGASYLYSWDFFPAASRTVFGLGGGFPDRSASFAPTYHRIQTIGVTFVTGVGGDVLKGEAAFVLGKYFGTAPVDQNGDGISDIDELKRNYFKYALGWDTRFWGVDTFLQFSQQRIVNWNPVILQDSIENGISIVFQKKLMYDRLELKLLVLYMPDHREAMIRPRVEYRFTDHLKGAFGADIFEGSLGDPTDPDSFHFIGYFDLNDRVYTELRYSF